ncbi:helix-turn-helix domain-containing protein [Paenibacillus elgii]|uniref:helix-turn-helix domain-containing protein n=1 Tax=Paenibacillus elgii TaxID=189691 RepID=UPI000248DEE1|nr:helix-turn-helix transcriptional regulator [Paenibacillus elgii]
MKYVVVRCRLDEVLEEFELERRHVTERTGLDRKRLSRYATNVEVMSLEVAVTIAEAIGVDPRQLYEWETIPITETWREGP